MEPVKLQKGVDGTSESSKRELMGPVKIQKGVDGTSEASKGS